MATTSSAPHVRLAVTQPPPSPTLVGLPLELILEICKHAVDDLDELDPSRGITGILALRRTCKTLEIKTSVVICELGVPLTKYGMRMLMRVARNPNIAPGITRIKLFFEHEERRLSPYRKHLKDPEPDQSIELTQCFRRLKGLRRVELQGMRSKELGYANHILYFEENKTRSRTPCCYVWQTRAVLRALQKTKANATQLSLGDSSDPIMCNWCPCYPFPVPQYFHLRKITKLHLDDTRLNLFGHIHEEPNYTTEMLEFMPGLEHLTLTHKYHRFSSNECGNRNYPIVSGWICRILDYVPYTFRLTTFHLGDCMLFSFRSLMAFLRRQSSTLRDVRLDNIVVLANEHHHSDGHPVAQRASHHLLQFLVDEMAGRLRRARFVRLTHRFVVDDEPGRDAWWFTPSTSYTAAVCWYPDTDVQRLDTGDMFEEVVKRRGLRRALEDWRDGLVMLYGEERLGTHIRRA